MAVTDSVPVPTSPQDDLYAEAASEFGPALERLTRAYEADPERRQDLRQEIHLALWRSFARFDGRCSTRTWVYRVAHNTATSMVLRKRSQRPPLVSLEEIEHLPAPAVDRREDLERLLELIQRLAPLDRQVILSYLEGLDAAETGEITGLSPGNVATRVHRIKKILARQFHEGERHGE